MSVSDGSISNATTLTATQHIERVCAVCVTYHPDSDLPERMSKVLRQVSHLIIVDNGSSAESLRMLSDIAKDDRVTVIACEENLGIARALNIGVDRALKLEHDFALLLDQDTSVNEDLVPVLTEIHRLHPHKDRLAIVGAGYEGSQQVRLNADDAQKDYEEVEAVIGSGSLLWLRAYEHIGPFREEFFIDYVDSEYCARAWKTGYLIVKTKRSLMVHKIGAPSRQRFLWMTKDTRNHSADRLYYQARNDTVMLRESGRYRAGLWRLKALNRAIRSCRRVIMFEHQKAAKVSGVLHGWCDGVRGRLGPRISARKFMS
jgi:rhamnosyltransferase